MKAFSAKIFGSGSMALPEMGSVKLVDRPKFCFLLPKARAMAERFEREREREKEGFEAVKRRVAGKNSFSYWMQPATPPLAAHTTMNLINPEPLPSLHRAN